MGESNVVAVLLFGITLFHAIKAIPLRTDVEVTIMERAALEDSNRLCVTSDAGLHVRSEPCTNGSVVAIVPYFGAVTIDPNSRTSACGCVAVFEKGKVHCRTQLAFPSRPSLTRG